MNFLSHFYFDRNTHSSELGLGLILPDLIHSHNKSWVFKPEKKEGEYEGKVLDLYNGWIRHKKVDKLFHNSPFFQEKTQGLKDKLQNAFSKSPVWSFFLAHITLELTLDSLLITQNKIQVNEFYALLEKVQSSAILEFLEINQVSDPRSFIPYFEEFLASGYLNKYVNPQELTYPLGRICYRIWKEKFTSEQNECLREAILDFCEQNQSRFMEIFDYIQGQL